MKVLTQELFFGLVGGLGFFLFGLSLMGRGFQRIAGDKIRRVLESTENVVIAVLAGLLLTVILQDGGAAMVLVLGLLGSGLIHFKQAISLMFGINPGAFPNRASNYFSVGELSATRCRAGLYTLFLRQTEAHPYLGQTV